MACTRHLVCALALLSIGIAPRQASADPAASGGERPGLDLHRLCAADVQVEVRHCPACTARAREVLCALRRGRFAPFTAEAIADSGDFRAVTGYVLSGTAALFAAGAAVALAVAYGERADDVGFNPLLFIGGYMLAVGAVGLGITGPLLVRSGNKRLEAAEMLRSFPAPPPAAGASIRLVHRF